VIDTSPLFEPFQLNKLTLANRFVMPGMQRGWCIDGVPLPKLTDYYVDRVEGGVSLIVTESLAVDHPSATDAAIFCRLNAHSFSAWKVCIGRVKASGGNILCQLWHEGALRQQGGDEADGFVPTLSASGLVSGSKANGRGATLREIKDIKHAFVASAVLAQDAGADGVEIHAAHGYLLDQFLWTATNLRVDQYGGNIVNRGRLVAEIIADVRTRCGPDFVISVRFSQWKEIDFEASIVRSPAELAMLLEMWQQAGADVFHASTRRFWEREWPDHDMNLAAWAKALSGIPSITVGSVGLDRDIMATFFGEEANPKLEDGLRELSDRVRLGQFDLVAVGRNLIGDSQWVRKVQDRRYADIRQFRRADLGQRDDIAMDFVAEANQREIAP